MAMATSRPDRPSAGEIIRWIEKYCYVRNAAGEPEAVQLAPFQKLFLEEVFDNPCVTRRAILSTGRKNAKSTTCAELVLVHLVGPGARPGSSIFSGAQSREQSSILFRMAKSMIELNPELKRAIRIRDTSRELFCDELGTSYRALSSDISTNYGLNWTFAVIDELGEAEGSSDPVYAALETASGAAVDPLMVVISTQSRRAEDLLSTLIDDALTGADPQVVCRLYSAPPDADPFSLEAIEAANPGFHHFQNQGEILRMAAEAKRLPSLETMFRARILNQRVDLEAAGDPFVIREVWMANAAPPHDLRNCRCWAGLDLSIGENDFSCFSMIGLDPIDASWSIVPEFWLASHDLVGREQRDKRPYLEWARKGLITLSEGRVISYDEAARRVFELDRVYRFQAIAFDRYNFGHFRIGLKRAGYSDEEIDKKFIPFGQGLASMTGALRAFETALLQHKVRHGSHPILNEHVAAAMVEHGDAGARKFVRRHARSRIDGAVATAMAFGCVPLAQTQTIDVKALIG
jgi:phage terminase large subunit-like protein